MPEAADVHGVLLADHPVHPTWHLGNREGNFWGRTEPPEPLEVTTAWYRGPGTSYDQSSPDQVDGLVPSLALFQLMGLRRAGDFVWEDESGGIIATDPAVREFGPASLLVREDRLTMALGQQSMGLLWTVVGEKQIIESGWGGRRDDDVRWLEVTATYLLDGLGLRRVQSRGRAKRAGAAEGEDRDWPLLEARPGSGSPLRREITNEKDER
jgi:hypothetical protein